MVSIGGLSEYAKSGLPTAAKGIEGMGQLV
jgi:hypothetical protein